jgi:hypothetical protein
MAGAKGELFQLFFHLQLLELLFHNTKYRFALSRYKGTV